MALTKEEQQKIDALGLGSQGVDIVDSDGHVVTNVPRGTNGIMGTGQKVYRTLDSKGNYTYSADPTKLPSSVTLDSATGKVVIRAPKDFLQSEVYEQYFGGDVALTGLSQIYAQNKDAKIPLNDGTEVTVPELVEKWNSQIQDLVNGENDYRKKKESIRTRYGDDDAERFTLGTYQIMGTSAYTGRDDDLLTIPKTILESSRWSFFKDLPGFDPKTLTISNKDFKEGYYHLEAYRDINEDTGIAKLKEEANAALSNYSGGDVEEFARLVAFNNYLADKSAEGASNAPKGSFGDTLAVGGYAVGEMAMRATARTGTDLINLVSNALLIPFSIVDWAGNLATTGKSEWNWISIADEIGKTENVLLGGDYSVAGYDTAAQFLDAEYAKRAQFYQLTNQTVATIATLTYLGTTITERFLQTKVLNTLILNTAALGISKLSLGKTVKAVGDLYVPNLVDEYGNAITGQQLVRENIARELLSSGSPESVVRLLTGTGSMTFREVMNAVTSINPAEFISAVYKWTGLVKATGEILSSGAVDNVTRYAEWYQSSRQAATAAGSWKTLVELETQYKNYTENLQTIWSLGNNLMVTSAKALTTLGNYAKFVPPLYYMSQVLVGTALTESENIKRLIQGVDKAEEREIIWGMVGRTLVGWTIGTIAGKIFNLVKSGFATPAVERANAVATERIAKVQTAIAGRVNQVHEAFSGPDWADHISNPVKKAVVKYNQSLQKSQQYLATAADQARVAGGTEAEATTATITAMGQMRANQNAIDLMQNTNLVVAEWHSTSYPAYANSLKAFVDIDKAVMDKLAAAGLDKDIQTTALIGGVATNGGLPQDIVNYQARALQRASYLRDDSSDYTITTPAMLKERDIAIATMVQIEAKYPKEITDYIREVWVPAAQQSMYQLNQILRDRGYSFDARIRGWQESGMFGKNNELYFPSQRITAAQKDFEEAARNPMTITRSGAIGRKAFEPLHYVPGSEEKTDFVAPMIVLNKVENQMAIDYATQNFIDVNLSNPLVKNEVKLDNAHTGAVKVYEGLKPTFERETKRALDSVKEDLDASTIVQDMFDKGKIETKIKNVKKKLEEAKKKVELIPDIEVTLSEADRTSAIEHLQESQIDEILQAAGIDLTISEPTYGFFKNIDYEKFKDKNVVGDEITTKDQLDALEYYIGERDKQVNAILRGDTSVKTNAKDAEMAKILKGVFGQNLKNNVNLYAGFVIDHWDLSNHIGEKVKIEGILPSSTDYRVGVVNTTGPDLKTDPLGRSILMRIFARPGTKVFSIPEALNGVAKGGLKENEIAFPHETEITIKAVHELGEVTLRGADLSNVRVIDVFIGDERLSVDEKREILKKELRRRCG